MTATLHTLRGTTLFDRAVEVWGTPERAMEWLESNDGKLQAKPAELATTEDGMIQVLHCLRSIEFDLCA